MNLGSIAVLLMRSPLRADPTTPATPRRKPSGRSPAVKRTPLIENIESDEKALSEGFGIEEVGYDPDNDHEEEDLDKEEPELEGHMVKNPTQNLTRLFPRPNDARIRARSKDLGVSEAVDLTVEGK